MLLSAAATMVMLDLRGIKHRFVVRRTSEVDGRMVRGRVTVPFAFQAADEEIVDRQSVGRVPRGEAGTERDGDDARELRLRYAVRLSFA